MNDNLHTQGGPMRIYLAARYSKHPEMQGVRDVLHALGHEVTSRWIDCHTDVTGDFTQSFTYEFLNDQPEKCGSLGEHDLADVAAADAVISFTYPPGEDGGKGGRHVEFGYGLALGKRMILVGPRQHVFHTLPGVEWYPDWSRLVMELTGGLETRLSAWARSLTSLASSVVGGSPASTPAAVSPTSGTSPARGGLEGRIVEPDDQRIKRRRPAMTYDGPLTGTVLETDVHHAFVLDGPAAGQWVTWPDHYQVVEFTKRSRWWRDAVMDEVVVTKTTTYHLERFAIQSLDSKRRMWKFFASVPGDQIDPSVPLFMLIDAEPSQVKLCEVSR